MYVKRYVVRRGRRQYVYLRLVEAFRDEQGRVRHRVLHTLGREDQLKASGQLDQLAAAFTRLDPPLAGTRREVGPLLLVGHYLDRLGLVALVDRQLPQRGRAQLTHGEVVAALVANRLCAPSPLYDVAGWGSSAAMAEVLDTPGCCWATTGWGARWRRWPRWPRRSAGRSCWPRSTASGSRPPGCTWT